MYDPACLQNGFSHRLDDARQFIRANMRMCLDQNVFIGTMLNQQFKCSSNVPAFVAACVEFAVAVSAGSAFSKAIIGIRIYFVLPVYLHQIPSALAHRLTSLYDYRTKSVANALQRSKETGGSRTDDVNFFRLFWKRMEGDGSNSRFR